MEQIVTMVGNTGFPIVMCLLMYKSNMENAKVIGELKEVLQDNTSTIKALWAKIERD